MNTPDDSLSAKFVQAVTLRAQYDQLREALGVDAEPAETLHERMMAIAELAPKLADTVARLEMQQNGVVNNIHNRNISLIAALEAATAPRPLMRRILNVFFPYQRGQQ